MQTSPPRETVEPNVKPILEWLALSHGQTGSEETQGLQQQLLNVRGTPLPNAQRLKLLDLLYGHASKITLAQLPALREVTLPISRRTRQQVRIIQDLLEALAQDYLNTLADLFDPQAADKPRPPLTALHRAMQCLSWHLLISELVAAPSGKGIWQQFHATFRTSRQLELATTEVPGDGQRFQQIYLSNLLVAVAQPASFTSLELEFISQYVSKCAHAPQLSDEAPIGHNGVFWIDPDRDTPAHALLRRPPPPETTVLYFACDVIAQEASGHLTALEQGKTAAELDLPAFADTHGGRGVLRRLSKLWGRPARRKFPRRRQSYRAELCSGLNRLWHLFNGSDPKPDTSEWMITNESPDGYAMMHVTGSTEQLRVGDIVAVHPLRDEATADDERYICIVRWALSENPEHVEVGMQVLAPHAIPVVLALPENQQPPSRTSALLLPKLPPLRPLEALVVPSGVLDDPSQKMVVLVEQNNLAVLELRVTQLNEQTSSIEIFTVEPDESL
jgi:hypothetical protein